MMKLIRINLSNEDKRTLNSLRRKFNDYRSERALAVLHCANGMKATHIAKILNRQTTTICSWLNRYKKYGIEGLNRNFSPGRPSKRNKYLIPLLEKYLQKNPRDYGWAKRYGVSK